MKLERIYYQTGRLLAVGLVAGTALWITGCGTYAKQTQSVINDAEATLKQAYTNQVRQLAADDLDRATGTLDSAKQSYFNGKYDAAQRQSRKTAADARLAQTRAELERRFFGARRLNIGRADRDARKTYQRHQEANHAVRAAEKNNYPTLLVFLLSFCVTTTVAYSNMRHFPRLESEQKSDAIFG